MNAAKPRGPWRRRLLLAAIAVPALIAALWYGNLQWLTRERQRVLKEAERTGPALWNDIAEALLAEHRRNPGAAEECKEALARLGGELGGTAAGGEGSQRFAVFLCLPMQPVAAIFDRYSVASGAWLLRRRERVLV